jgi:hypothetical protein
MSGDVNGNSSNKRDRLQDTNIRLTPALDTCTQVLHVKWSRPMLNGNERQRRLTALGCCRNVAPSVSFQCDIGGLNCRGLSWTAVPSAVGQTALARLCWWACTFVLGRLACTSVRASLHACALPTYYAVRQQHSPKRPAASPSEASLPCRTTTMDT